MEDKDIKQQNCNKIKIEEYTLQRPTHLFRFFLRKNYKEIDVSNEECDAIGGDFYEYLRDLDLTEEQKVNILPKDTLDVILNADHPIRSNSFPPAYVLHFTQFIEQQKEKTLAGWL
jgi:hypothetical protein